MINRDKLFRFARFCVVGGTVFTIDFSIVAMLRHFFPPLVTVSIALLIAVTFHFLLNKFWVFRCRRTDLFKQVLQYLPIVGVNWLITMIVVKACLSTFTHEVLIAKAVAVPCAMFFNFAMLKLIVFRGHQEEELLASHTPMGLPVEVPSEQG